MKKSILFTTIPAILLGIVMSICLVPTPVSAGTPVEDLFELDGNTIDQTAIGNPDDEIPPDDWGQGNDTTSSGYVAGPAVNVDNPGGDAGISAFIDDPNGDTGMDNIFTGGGSKDDLPIKGWKWTTGTPPDKDDLLQVGAAAYTPDGELLIYDFGSLYAANGTSSIGNWFFKKDIGPCSDGSFGVVDSSNEFRPCLPDAQQPESIHTKGDVLIISENSNGGKITNISFYTWVAKDATACALAGGTFVPPKKNLCLIGEFAASTCGTTTADPYACGIMNQVPTESVYDYGYMSKSPPDSGATHPAGTNGIAADDHPAFTFFESGINISELLGNAECFSSFMKNTRTSASPRSQMKDFAGGAFELCGLEVVKTCPTLREDATGGYCQHSDFECASNADCDTSAIPPEQCAKTNPLFLFGDTVRTQFAVTVSKKGPADLANVMLTEVTLAGCEVIAVDGVELGTSIGLPQNVATNVLASLTDSTTLVMECDSNLAISNQKVIAKATTVSGFSQVGPEEFTLIDSNCKPAPVPGLNIDKVCNGRVTLDYDTGGDLQFTVPVKITVSNTGDEDLVDIVVSDNQYGLIDNSLSLEKGDPAQVYEITYDTAVPDGTAPWAGCDVQFSDIASIEAATGVFSGPVPTSELPLDVPATCVFCPENCERTSN